MASDDDDRQIDPTFRALWQAYCREKERASDAEELVQGLREQLAQAHDRIAGLRDQLKEQWK